MSLLIDLSEFAYGAELEDMDFSAFQMPDFASSSRVIEAQPTPTAVRSPRPQPLPASPQAQPRRPSPVIVRRRSNATSNETALSLTLECQSGKKNSWNMVVDNSTNAELFNNMFPATQAPFGQMLPPPSQLQALPLPSATLPRMRLPPRTSHVPSYVPAAVELGQRPVLPLQHPTLPTISRYGGHVPAMIQRAHNNAKRPANLNQRHHAPTRPQHQAVGGRPPLPDGLALFVSPNYPVDHGRVPDKRGNKDTTLANDFYYSISALLDLELPQCGINVAYNGIEFEPKLRFTGLEFLEYLHCALQRPNRHPILRVQIQPAQYNHRYKRAGDSFKCRFASCPVKKGTILKGQARVCISEFEDDHGDWLNPFHNAGYVHLDCLEKQVNFVELYHSQTVTIIPETRSLQHEPPATINMRTNNPMALNDVERNVVHVWFQEMTDRWDEYLSLHPDPALRPAFDLAAEDTLTYRLTTAHIVDNKTLQRVQQKRKREAEADGRTTAHLNEFVGDVGKQVALQNKMKTQQQQQQAVVYVERRESLPQPAASKRRRINSPSHAATVEEQMPEPLTIGVPPQGDVYALQQPKEASHLASAPDSALERDGRPSISAPSRRRPSAALSTTTTQYAGVTRRRSSVRLAVRRASTRISSTNLTTEMVSFLERESAVRGEIGDDVAAAAAGEADSLFGTSEDSLLGDEQQSMD
ncbi:unnamed protein product [Discula destructiva]